MSGDLVHLEPGTVTTIRLDNPPLNLVSKELTAALDEALARVEADPGVRVVILAGAGERAFCAGSDVKEFASLHGRVGEGKLVAENAVYDRLARLPLPTIAAIEGDALGGGLELALCCDFRVSSRRARLGMPEVRLGVLPGSGGTRRLPPLIGLGRAKEMIMLGEIVDATVALELGLVNRIADVGEAEQLAGELAETLALRAPIAVRTAKSVLDGLAGMTPDEAVAAELAASERVFASEDMLEGVAAFLEKRPAHFKDR
jgi:enoyl-CoA hydratase/carnithine racemase